MSAYKVTLFKNTGFNGVNIPDSPSVLLKCEHEELPSPVQILQDRGLGHITISATWSQVENVDYVKVGSWYYSVPAGGVQMVNVNTCTLTLLSDPITSAGGFSITGSTVTSKFKILDGITDRATVQSDKWGEYDTDDPLVAPQKPLKLKTEWLLPENGKAITGVDGDPVLIETTVSLEIQAQEQSGQTYTDPETQQTVTCPAVHSIESNVTKFGFAESSNTPDEGTRIYIRNDNSVASGALSGAEATIDQGISNVRSLGIEQGSIINQWRVPKEYMGEVTKNITLSGTYTNQNITLLKGVKGTLTPSIAPDYADVKNKRVLYGQFNNYGLMTTSGNSCEFKPEEITDEKTAPGITYESDVRPKGKPYFRFTSINSNKEFWRNALAGSEWENVPLVYQGASGSALTRLNFENSRKVASLGLEQSKARTGEANTMATIGGMESSANAMMNMDITRPASIIGGSMAIGTSALNTAAQIGINNNEQARTEAMYSAQKATELSQLYQATTIYAPTVNFPYNADIIRDIKGNGVLLYKYEMDEEDVKRIDKLLTMYGYRTSEPLNLDFFGRRKHFDYVSCSSVTIGGLPKWWCEQIGSMLRNGVRIWHELPNREAYTDNPVV